jgi:hypothetical protein
LRARARKCAVGANITVFRDAAVFDDSPVVYSPWLSYGPVLIGGIAGLVAFFVTAAIMGAVIRRRDRISLERPRRPLPGNIQPMPLEPMRSRAPSRQAPHIGWLLILLAVALIGAVVVVLWTPQAKGDGIHRHSLQDARRAEPQVQNFNFDASRLEFKRGLTSCAAVH